MVAARAGQRAALSSLAASSMNHTQSNATPPQATPAETPRNEEGTVSKIDFAFEDVIDAQIRSAAVDVHYSRFRESYKQCDTRLSVRKVKRDAQVPGASRTNETQERYERPRNGPGPRRKLRAVPVVLRFRNSQAFYSRAVRTR